MKKYLRPIIFIQDILTHTPFLKMAILLVGLWLIFSAGMFLSEKSSETTHISSYGEALYWGVAAFSTAGIADAPVTGLSRLIGGIWIIIGSALFFGTIVATITTYFFRSYNRPSRQIIDTIEYNLERLDDLSILELDLLKQTVDTLILQMEKLKTAQFKVGD
jgi:voltage-gated potassium channel